MRLRIKAGLEDYYCANSMSEFTISMGVGNTCFHISEIRISMIEAILALNSKFFKGKGLIFHISQNNENCSMYNENEKDFLDKEFNMKAKLMDSAISCDSYHTILYMKDYLEWLKDSYVEDAENIQIKLVELFIHLGLKARESGFDISSVYVNELKLYKAIVSIKSFVELKNYSEELCTKIISTIKVNKLADKGDTINSIKQYIQNNFTTKLMLKDIADNIFMNPSYLSTLFKAKTGLYSGLYCRS